MPSPFAPPKRPVMRQLDVYPTGGMTKLEPGMKLPPDMSPDMINCVVNEGMLKKRPGQALFPLGMAALDGPIVGIYSTQDEENNTHMVCCTPTSAYKYSPGTDSWVLMTGPAFTGTSSHPFSFETSQNSIVFSQGVDKIVRHDISLANTDYALLDANAPAARYLARFVNRLIAAHTVETGNTRPFRIRRSTAGNHADWVGAGSGFTDLTETPYHIRGIKALGQGMAVYTEKNIWMGTRQTSAQAPFRLDQVVTSVGLYAERTIQNLPGSAGQAFLGNDDVYVFNGSQERAIGTHIRDIIFGNLSPAQLRRDFAELLTDSQEYLLFLATGGSEAPTRTWVFNYGRNIWYPWTVSDLLCGTLHRIDSTLTIDQAIGTIDEQIYEIDTRNLLNAYPALLTGGADGRVYRWGTYPSDNGQAIFCRWTSKDFESDDVSPEAPKSEVTLRSITIIHRDMGLDATLNFYLSTDEGKTWSGPFPVVLRKNATVAQLTEQITGPRVRFKFEHDSASETFQILQFKPELELGAELTI